LSLLSLSKCAALAPQLRLAATSEFVAHGGPLDQLRAAYGGFHFKSVSICEPGTQYYQLNLDRADVANGITTDASVDEDQLVILADDRHVLPEYRCAPVVRMSVLRSHPAVRAALNRVSRMLTVYALQEMSMHRDVLGTSPEDLAEQFLRRHRNGF
jgi:glycine betaine/choline ABC-type transport system substrate-binding protein